MKSKENHAEYEEAIKKIDLLLDMIRDNHSYDNPDFVMMDRLSDLVAFTSLRFSLVETENRKYYTVSHKMRSL